MQRAGNQDVELCFNFSAVTELSLHCAQLEGMRGGYRACMMSLLCAQLEVAFHCTLDALARSKSARFQLHAQGSQGSGPFRAHCLCDRLQLCLAMHLVQLLCT